MFIDAAEIELGTEIEADICIVGGGAAGISIARHLEDSGASICLLEGGGLCFDPALNDLYKGNVVGLPYFRLDVCQLRALGGNTNGWGGWCRPLDPIDFLEREWVADSGWAFRSSELAPYYRLAHEMVEIADEEYDAGVWNSLLSSSGARVLPFNPSLLETAIYRFSPPTRFGRVYEEDLRKSRTIRCILRANAVDLERSANGAEITRVVAARPDATRFSVRPRHCILAAGGTENARLLLVSRGLSEAGVANSSGLVGRYFMEHPHTKRRIVPLRPDAPVSLYGLKHHARGVSARLVLPEMLQRRERLLNYSGNIHAHYRGHEAEGWMALRKLVLSASRSRQNDPYLRFPPYGPKQVDLGDLWRIARELPTVTLAGFLQLLQPTTRFIDSYVLESKSEQAPNPDSRIRLCHDRDALGVQRIQLDWRTLPIDRHTVVRAEGIIGTELERLGIGRLEPLSPEHVESWPSNLEGGWHQLGMTRMHADPRRGVVGPDLRAHGVANLWIVGGSVFPTVGAAPPTLTIVALAFRLADRLRQALGVGGLRAIEDAPAPAPADEVEFAAAARTGLVPT